MLNQDTSNGLCISCGSRQVKRVNEAYVKCCVCGLLEPNLTRRVKSDGLQHTCQPFDKKDIDELLDALQDTFDRPGTKHQLEKVLEQCKGDIFLIFQDYLPVVFDALHQVIPTFGFQPTHDGIVACVQTLQTHARDDERVIQFLQDLRRILTPTGRWIEEDAETHAIEKQRKLVEEEEARRELEVRQQKEREALDRARRAKLRAKKLALGLDPDKEQLPLLDTSLPSRIVAHEHTSVVLRVRGKYIQHCQWYLDNKLISDRFEHQSVWAGADKLVLVIHKLTRRTIGEYYCVCENEEGMMETSKCSVSIVKLQARTVASRKANPPSFFTKLMTVSATYETIFCTKVDNNTSLVTPVAASTLTPSKVFAPVRLPTPSHAHLLSHTTSMQWSDVVNLLVVTMVTSNKKTRSTTYTLLLYTPVDVEPPRKESLARSSVSKRKSKLPVFSRKPEAAKHFLSQVTTPLPEFKKDPKVVLFAAKGELVVVSDLHRTVAIYAQSPDFHLVYHWQSPTEVDIVAHVSTATTCPYIAVSFQHQASMLLMSGDCTESRWVFKAHSMDLAAPSHCTAFDDLSFHLVIADATSCFHTYLSVVNVHTKLKSRRRFPAHRGTIMSLEWTKPSNLLISSGVDGYIKLWDLEAGNLCIWNVHVHDRGVARVAFLPLPSMLVSTAFAEGRLQTRQFVQLSDFEARRCDELDGRAATIQKVWKGRQTRQLIAAYIKPQSM